MSDPVSSTPSSAEPPQAVAPVAEQPTPHAGAPRFGASSAGGVREPASIRAAGLGAESGAAARGGMIAQPFVAAKAAVGAIAPAEGAMRDVRWTSIVGAHVNHAIRERAPSAGVISVLSAADELAAYADLDTILRRAVELLRDRLGLERAGIYLEDAVGETMRGTFGTGLSGETADERHLCYPRGRYEAEAHARAAADTGRWLVIDEAPHVAHVQDTSVVLGYGWLAMIPIRSQGRPLGILHNDCAFSGAPMDEAKQLRAAVFCSLLGNLIEARRTTKRNAAGLRPPHAPPGPGWFSATGQVALAARDSLPGKTVEMLRREPTLTGREIAERLGVSDGHLARVFKNATQVSLVEFRNRVRLERFFAIVDQGGKNLHEACLRSGFGSYAQFHRVFRDLLGATPSEYLTGRRRREFDPETDA